MNIRHLFVAGLAAATLAGSAYAGTNKKPADSVFPAHGYLKAGQFNVTPVLPPAPVKGDPRYDSDRAIFKKTRKLVGTPRYQLATQDAKFDTRNLMKDFSCAVGVTLSPETAPHVAALVAKAGKDTQDQTHAAKMHYKRLRPFLIDDGTTCQPKSVLKHSYDYPSGHTTWGWTWGTILAQLVPARANEILARGRAYGDSRIVCGAHNNSAVDNGRLSASSTMAFVETLPAYQKDFAVAQKEIQALIHNPKAARPSAKSCQVESKLVHQNIFK